MCTAHTCVPLCPTVQLPTCAQTRINLPVWLGIGEALKEAIDGGEWQLGLGCDSWVAVGHFIVTVGWQLVYLL